MDWTAIVPAISGAFIGGIGTYVAIRVDLAVLKTKVDHLEFRSMQNYDQIGDAHDRINRLRRGIEDTR